jgi:hypothetical protein
MKGADMRASQRELAREFDRVPVPRDGRYVNRPANVETGGAYRGGAWACRSEGAAEMLRLKWRPVGAQTQGLSWARVLHNTLTLLCFAPAYAGSILLVHGRR